MLGDWLGEPPKERKKKEKGRGCACRVVLCRAVLYPKERNAEEEGRGIVVRLTEPLSRGATISMLMVNKGPTNVT